MAVIWWKPIHGAVARGGALIEEGQVTQIDEEKFHELESLIEAEIVFADKDKQVVVDFEYVPVTEKGRFYMLNYNPPEGQTFPVLIDQHGNPIPGAMKEYLESKKKSEKPNAKPEQKAPAGNEKKDENLTPNTPANDANKSADEKK